MRQLHFIASTGLMLIALGTWLSPPASASDEAFFEKEVRPLLVQHCYKCHSGVKASGGLVLDTRDGWKNGGESGPAIVPGNLDESLLIEAINYGSIEMPPRDAGGMLSDAEIASLTKWVKDGALDPRDSVAHLGGMTEQDAITWWAFQPLPQTLTLDSPSAIDQLIAKQLSRLSLVPAALADRRTLIRRATYDLIGLPPTPEEVSRFLSDSSDDAFAKVVDRLLESPQYGVKWGRHWLDVVRYADTAGENTDRPLPHAWRYRNWVIDAVNRDLPYDRFVQLQIAGDILQQSGQATNAESGVVATGYLAIARRFGHDIDKDIHLMHEDVIDNLGKNFLGLSIGCARCHDHKYDPVTAEDYYALYGIFHSTRFAFSGCEAKGQPRDLVPLMTTTQMQELTNVWRERNADALAASEQRDQSLAALAKSVKEASSKSSRLLAAASVGEGASVTFAQSKQSSLDNISLEKGELLQLTVSPGDSHGADTTLVDWTISTAGDNPQQWKLADLVPQLLRGNPQINVDGSAWCFIDVTDGPNYLLDKHLHVQEQEALKSWSSGDTPSVFVNQSEAAVNVWTSLPPQSFFIHPGNNRPVAVAWICPEQMNVSITGHVADVHPSGSDGIAFRLEQIAAPTAGPALIELGQSLQSPTPVVEPEPVSPLAYAVAEGEPNDAPLQLRGDPEQLGDSIPRRWLSIFGGDSIPPDAGSGRRQLADWVAGHPLAARVMVNRIWQWHFGRGLVASPNDFGSRGDAASHPELLDAVAATFQQSGYSLKAMHRLVMNTAAYQRSSSVTDAVATSDPDNRYLTRFARRRLNAEEIRDSLLVAAGSLDRSPAEGHPFPPQESWTFTQHNPFVATYDTNRRSVYLMVQRQRRDPFLALFDGADPNASTAARETTTVPTQALYFLNAPFFHEQAERLAKRVVTAPNVNARMARAFSLLYQREPTDDEHARLTKFLATYPGSDEEQWTAYARVLLAANEFLYLD